MARLSMFMVSLALVFLAQTGVGSLLTYTPNTVILDHFDGSTTGTAYGGITYEPAQDGYGQAALFGDGRYIRYALAPMEQGTIELWVKPSVSMATVNTGFMTFNWLNMATRPSSGYVYHMQVVTEVLGVSAWPSGNVTASTTLDQVDEWVHLAASWGPDGTKLYVNGVVDGFSASSLSISYQSPTYVYLNYWGDGHLYGLVDELHISNIQLSDVEVAAHADILPEPASLMLIVAGPMLSLWRRRQKQSDSGM